MSKALITESLLTNISKVIDSTDKTPAQMATALQTAIASANTTTGESDTTIVDAVQSLSSGYGGITPSGTIQITENGTVDVTNYASAEVDVSGGGDSLQGGSFTLAENSKTITVALDAAVTHFVFYASDYPTGTDSAGWHTVGGFWVNSHGASYIRYNNANYNMSSNQTVSVSDDSITYTATYNLLAGKTYYWYAW